MAKWFRLSGLDDLRSEVTKLKALLDDPQPGLMSWCMAYNDRMKAIVDFWQTPLDLEGKSILEEDDYK